MVPSPELDANKSFVLRSMRNTGPVCSVSSKDSMDLSRGVTLMVISSEHAAKYYKRYKFPNINSMRITMIIQRKK